MYECDSWTIKKAEHQRINAFELWCWRKLLRVPRTARRSNQSILNEINLEFSLDWLMLKLKLQYFGHLMWRADSLEKNPDAGKDGRQEENGVTVDEMVGWYHWLNGHEFEQASGVGDGQWSLPCSSPWGPTKSRTQTGNWIRSVITRHSKLLSVISWRSLLLFSLWSIWTLSWSNELSKTEGVNLLLSYSFSFFPPILPSCFLQNNNGSTLPTSVSSLPVSCFCKTWKKFYLFYDTTVRTKWDNA